MDRDPTLSDYLAQKEAIEKFGNPRQSIVDALEIVRKSREPQEEVKPKLFDYNFPSPSEIMQSSILASIASFEEGLDENHEVGGCFVQFSDQVLSIEEVGFRGSSLIVFRGRKEGAPYEIVQSVAQVNYMLVSVPKTGAKARRIGFINPEED